MKRTLKTCLTTLVFTLAAGCATEGEMADWVDQADAPQLAEYQHSLKTSSGQADPPRRMYTQASSEIFTWENEEWFHDLINLNPNASVATKGQAIVVTNPSDEPLRLPKGPQPADVKLSNPI